MQKRTMRILPALFVVFAFVFGCSQAITPALKKSAPQGVYHQVKKGETLWSISRAYNVGIQQIAEANKITNVSQIKEDSVLFIPGAERTIDYTQKTAALEPEQFEEEFPAVPEYAVKEPKIASRDLGDSGPAPAAPVKKEVKNGSAAAPPPAKAPAAVPGGVPAVVPANVPAKAPAKTESKPQSKPPDKTEAKPPIKADAQPPAKIESKPAENAVPPVRNTVAPAREVPEQADIDKKKFAWPVKGAVASRYGIQPNGMKINGIRILAADSAPIFASAAGAVIHSANIKYYGDTVIIKHDDNFSTVYCHLKDRAVKVGDIVKKGDKIALVGKPENGDGKSYLHFEVRYRSKPRDPMQYLP
jgi:lipoprotein NlpD